MLTGSLRATEANPDGLTGLSGMAADVIAAIGEVGVGLLTFVETVFPPIPSEIILPLSGYLAERGRLNVVLVILAATVGSLLGALVLYGLGAVLGEERARRVACLAEAPSSVRRRAGAPGAARLRSPAASFGVAR